MVRGIISSRLQAHKVDSLVYCEYLSLADTLLVECLERYRYDLHKDFTGLYRCAFRNRSLDLKKTIEKRLSTIGIQFLLIKEFVNLTIFICEMSFRIIK